MTEEKPLNELSDDVFWKKLITKYWYFALILGLIILGAIAGFLLVMNWFVNVRSIVNLGLGGNALLGDFTPKTGILFFIYFILWELLLVALPGLAAVGFLFAIIWFIVLKDDEKDQCKIRSKKDEEKKKKRRKTGRNSGKSGGAFNFFVFVGFLIKIAVDGNWNMPLSNPTMNIGYFTNSWIIVTLWLLLIIGVPGLIFAILWFWKKFGTQ